MSKQTAVEWLQEQLNPDMKTMQGVIVQDLLEQAKEIEKEQMMKTWTKAIDQTQERAWNVVRAYDDFDDYYNETYGGDK
jgi:uncharacterized protein